MVLGWLKKKQDPFGGKAPQEVALEFERELTRHDDLIFGVSLFFECLSLLFAGREDVIQSYRKQLRNVLQQGQQVSDTGRDLLRRLQQSDESALDAARKFEFSLFLDGPEKMETRCEILANAYRKTFPGRARNQPLKDDDVFLLVQTAVVDLAVLPADA